MVIIPCAKMIIHPICPQIFAVFKRNHQFSHKIFLARGRSALVATRAAVPPTLGSQGILPKAYSAFPCQADQPKWQGYPRLAGKTAGDVCASHGGLYVPSFRASAACEISLLDQRSSHTSRPCSPSREPTHCSQSRHRRISSLCGRAARSASAL